MAAGTEYRTACQRTWNKPVWQGDPASEAWQGVMGGALDVVLDNLQQARAVRYPQVPKDPDQPQYACPSDALGYLGAERGIERAPGESEDSWRGRIRDAWRIWSIAGTPAAAREVCGWLGLTTARAIPRPVFSTPPAVGSLYVRGFARAHHAQHDVLVERPHPFTERIWGASGTTWGTGTWGSSATPEQVGFLQRNLRRFRSGCSTCTYLHLSHVVGRVWGSKKWGDGGVWGGSGNVTTIVVGEDHWAPRGLL